MERNVKTTESSLLLQLPKSVLSFSDMSGNSFLLPVAVDNVAASSSSADSNPNPEIIEGTTNVTEPSSVCQLQQPLLMRRGSSPGPKMSVPYSEANTQSSNTSAMHTEPLQSVQPPVLNSADTNQVSESQSWPNSSMSSSVGQSFPSNLSFSDFQNQPPVVEPEYLNQINSFQSVSHNQPSSNLGYQNIYTPQPTVSPSSSFPSSNVPVTSSAYPGFSEKSNDYPNSSSFDCYMQPPVITPSTMPPYCSSLPEASQGHTSYTTENFGQNTSTHVRRPKCCDPVFPFWFYNEKIEGKEVWSIFAFYDSQKLEEAYQQDPDSVDPVPVKGGRYDAILKERVLKAVYFEAADCEIRRCTWFFYEHSQMDYRPFSEETANIIEVHYMKCLLSGQWHKRIPLPGFGTLILEDPDVQMIDTKDEAEVWAPLTIDAKSLLVPLKRGIPDNVYFPPSENSSRIDHLVFIVQGIGSVCDFKFRTVTECVDGFREIANKLLSVHFRGEISSGKIGRVEFLPLGWHAKLHMSDKGFDRCIQNITLPSIPKMRHFTNDTLLDILLYSSPFYCQCILDTVATELNSLHEIFLKRNPGFSGKVFVAGHSLGSLILFDILAHQKLEDMSNIPRNLLARDPNPDVKSDNKINLKDNFQDKYDSLASLLQACQLEEYMDLFEKEKIDLSSVTLLSNDDLKDLGLPTGPRKKLLNTIHCNDNQVGDTSGLPSSKTSEERKVFSDESERLLVFPYNISPCMQSISYPRLCFQPAGFFALGSPISMFMAVRGYEIITEDFKFPTCPAFFNIFHPYDPVAYRIEKLINPNFSAEPVLIPHHKGRKRMHLAIRENLSKMGTELKQRLLDTLTYTWNSVIGRTARSHIFPVAAVEAEVDRLVNMNMEGEQLNLEQTLSETTTEEVQEVQIGCLNGGRRIDYVLQEKPIEAINDYVFSLASHSTYWTSEDTILMILREIYATDGILVSSQSVLENAQFSQPEQSTSPIAYVPIPRLFKNGAAAASVSSFCPQNSSGTISAPPTNFPSFSVPLYQSASNVPPLSSTAQPVRPPLVSTVQQVGVPPASAVQQVGVPPASAVQQVGVPPASAVQQVGIPPASTAQPVGPLPVSTAQPPAPTTQPVGPPPLTGFIKKSPFAR